MGRTHNNNASGQMPDVGRHWETSGARGPTQARSSAVERSRGRLVVLTAGLIVAFTAVAWRLGELSFFPPAETQSSAVQTVSTSRPDVVDRSGVLIARDIATLDISLDPSKLDAPGDTADVISFVLPEIDPDVLRQRFSGDRRFAYVLRNATPKDAATVHGLGLPGVSYDRVWRRAYPKGRLFSHVLGFVGRDNEGLAGLELTLDTKQEELRPREPTSRDLS